MSSHSEGSDAGRRLCDGLLSEFEALWAPRGGASRTEAKEVCSFGPSDGHKTAYVYHRKRKASVRIYIEGDPGSPPADLPETVSIHVRPRSQSAWEKRFPFFFDLEEYGLLPGIAASLAQRAGHAGKPGMKAWRDEILPAEEVSQPDIWEGAVKKVSVNVYERNRPARKACLRRWGTACTVCSFDFATQYGVELSGFIHVHHLVPVAEIGKRYKLDPVNDLRPVCPNCHAVIHRRTPPFSIEEAKALLVTGSKRTRGAAEPAVAADGASRRR